MLAVSLIFLFIAMALYLELRHRQRPHGYLRTLSSAAIALAVLGVVLFSTGARALAPGVPAGVDPILTYALVLFAACRVASNFFPVNTIAYRVLHALGMGTGAEAATAAQSAQQAASSSTSTPAAPKS